MSTDVSVIAGSDGDPIADRFGRLVDVSDSLMALRVAWAAALLAQTAWPLASNNLVSWVAWETAEGGGFYNIAQNNPVNCTIAEPGSRGVVYTGWGNVWVQAYPSEAEGIAATLTTLGNGDYPEIEAAFAANSPPVATCEAIGASPWGTIGAVLLECIPEAAAAVAQYWTPPAPEVDVGPFIEFDKVVYQFVPSGASSYWRPWPAAASGILPASAVLQDPSGAAFSLWKHSSPTNPDAAVYQFPDLYWKTAAA